MLFALIVALVVSVAMGVFWRYALQRSLFWATEVPNFLFVWIVFLGAVVAYHEKKHIAFTALLDVVPPRTRAAVEIIGLLLVTRDLRVPAGYGMDGGTADDGEPLGSAEDPAGLRL